MKKIVTVFMAAIFCFGSFADDFTKTLHNFSKTINAFDNTKASPVTESIPEGKDIFPLLWKYAFNEPVLEKNVIAFKAEIKSMDLFQKNFDMVQRVYYKYGIGLQCQESYFTVSQEDANISVLTTKMQVYGVDKNLKRINEPYDNQPKSLVVNSSNILKDLVNDAKNLDDGEYQKWSDLCYSDLTVQQLAGFSAGNQLKAKKWYQAHSIEGKNISENFTFADLKESDREGYEYKLSAIFLNVQGTSMNNIMVTVYSNNDKYMDLKDGQTISVSGKVTKVIYSGEYSSSHVIHSLEIEE
ncbi:MAG: hypothetical protein K6E78_11140 [Treponema sp.]|nr:hypothetical protein [Treponema sp.]